MSACTGGDGTRQEVELRALAAAVYAFDGDEPAESAFIDLWMQSSLTSWKILKAQRAIFSLTADFRRCNAAHARI